MAIRAVVFDIGGVLEITPRTGWAERWETLLHLPPGGLRDQLVEVWRGGSVGAITEAEVERRTAALLGFDQAQHDAFMADIWAEYLGTLNAELNDYFIGLRPRYRTGILSNSFVGAREREQATYGFVDRCDLIIYSHEVGLAKPDLRIYALTCERLGVRPDELIFLDDVAVCVAATNEQGIYGILYRDNAQEIGEIEALLGSG